jgi:hypothetical protein
MSLAYLLVIIYILTEMNKTKSTAQSGTSTTKPIFISTNIKCMIFPIKLKN